jgi:hypothetical protein
VAVLADCKCGKKPEPPPLEHVTELVIEDSGVALPEAAAPIPPHGRPWIRFAGPPFTTETPMHGGPDWSFETDLPAVDAAGNVALAFDATHDLSDLPNLAVRTIAPDGHVLAMTWLLEVKEFADALEAPSKKSAFATLSPKVAARVKAANAELDAKGYAQLGECKIDEAPYSEHPPCSMKSQTIHCGSVTVQYSGQTLTIAGTKLPFPAWKKPAQKTAYGPVEVKECFGSAYFEESRKVFVGELTYECQTGGDWCTIEPEWRIVTF